MQAATPRIDVAPLTAWITKPPSPMAAAWRRKSRQVALATQPLVAAMVGAAQAAA